VRRIIWTLEVRLDRVLRRGQRAQPPKSVIFQRKKTKESRGPEGGIGKKDS